jgi:hypothetical protein
MTVMPFHTITGADWKRQLADARAQENVAWREIQERLYAVNNNPLPPDSCAMGGGSSAMAMQIKAPPSRLGNSDGGAPL